MSSHKAALAYINQEGSDLPLNSSKRIVCPFCEAKHERSFVIKRVEAGYLYHCFRASCGRKGIVGSTQLYNHTPRKDSKPKGFVGNLVPLPEDIYQRRYSRYNVSYQQLVDQGIKYAAQIERVYVPFFDYRGYQIAEDLRSFTDSPKACIYPLVASVPLIHFPCNQQWGSTILLVEDYLSAIKCSTILYSCSITGTHLSREGIEQFLSIGIKKIIVMLDGNATKQALRIHNSCSPFFGVRVVKIDEDKDPKDLTYQQLEELLC